MNSDTLCWTCHVTASVHHREATLDLASESLTATRLPRPQGSSHSISLLASWLHLLPQGFGLLAASMSRRESRMSMNERQNDALFEFEICLYRSLFRTSHASPLFLIPSHSQEEVSPRQ